MSGTYIGDRNIMATRITRIDDVDGTTELPEGNPQTRLTLSDGRESFDVLLDLGDTTFKALVKALGKYSTAGTVVLPEPARKASTAGKSDAAEVRAWAVAHGYSVKDKGAIPAPVRAAYESFLANGDVDPIDAQDAANGDMTPGA
jgi:hypothetical protein